MGKVPLSIPLAVLLAIIVVGDSLGLRKPQEPPFYGQGVYSGNILSAHKAAQGYVAVIEVDRVDSAAVKPFKMRMHLLFNQLLISGEYISFRADLHELFPKPDIPDALDLFADIRRQGVTADAEVPLHDVLCIAPTRTVRYYCAVANNRALDRLGRCGLNAEAYEILGGMLLGRSRLLESDTRKIYSAAGLSHLLALSGMHVGIIAMIVALTLWPFYFTRHVRSRLLLTIFLLFGYAAFTGFIPSVTRAVIMASVYMAGKILQRKTSSLNSLCLAAIIILVVNPGDIYSAGFQMSFAAVLGIIIFYPLLNRVNRRNHPWLYRAVSYPALSVSAMILTSVVAAFHFHTFPLYFLFANLVVAPIIPLAIGSGVVSLIFEIPFISNCLIDSVDWIALNVSTMPHAVIFGLYPAVWESVALFAATAILGLALASKNTFWKLASVIVFVGLSLGIFLRPEPNYPRKEVYFVKRFRYQLIITKVNDSCTIIAYPKTAADMTEIEELYPMLLEDYMAKRGIVKLDIRREKFE